MPRRDAGSVAGALSWAGQIVVLRGRFSPSLRLGLFYAALYISTGVSAPYMSVWLRAGGYSGLQIGAILAFPLLARIVTGPLLAIWADGFARRRTPIVILCMVTSACFAAMMAVRGFWPVAVLWFGGATLSSACTPLADVIVLRRAAEDGFPYARPRGIGSCAYVAANIAGGSLLTPLGPTVVLIWITAAAAAAAALSPLLLPADPVRDPAPPSAHPPPGRLSGLRGLLSDPTFMLMIGSAGMIQAAHGFYYSFSTLVWRAHGLSPSIIGLLWGVGVGVEVAFLWFGEGWRRRLGSERLLILGGLGALVRWTSYALSPPVWLLFPLQALHALSFTATFVASLDLAERLSPRQSASAAQSLNAALYSGLLIGLSTVASGPLFDHFGAQGYWAMAALAGVGALGAWRLRRRLIRRA